MPPEILTPDLTSTNLLGPSILSAAAYLSLALFFLAYPLFDAWSLRRDRQSGRIARLGSAWRLREYRKTIVLLWLVSGLVAVLAWSGELTSGDLRLVPQAGFVPLLTTILTVIACRLLLLQTRGFSDDAELRAKTRQGLQHSEVLIPRNRLELRWFAGLSLTAGFCEELVYRAFLLAILTPTLGFWGAALLSTLAFGFAHIYQGGFSGFLRTAPVGAVLLVVIHFSGSIWPAVVLHAVIDLVAGYIGFLCSRDDESPVPEDDLTESAARPA